MESVIVINTLCIVIVIERDYDASMKEHMWRDWLNRRGITDSVIEEFGLSYKIGDSIVIPIYAPDGIFSFNKYRRDPLQGDVKPKYKYDTGSQAKLYGAHKIGRENSVLITEGELDALVAWSLHIPAVSSTGGAGTFSEDWTAYLHGKDVTICFDNDPAGAQGMVKVLALIPTASVLFLPDRPGIKDISDYVGSGGDLNELLRSRVHFSSLQDVIDDRAVRLSLWQSTFFHDAFIEAHTVPEFVRYERSPGTSKNVGIDGDVVRAKSYPITDMLTFNREHKALCIWHSEKTPSLHYYKKNNTVYCFGGCGKAADAIDVYRKLHGSTFGEAVKALL